MDQTVGAAEQSPGEAVVGHLSPDARHYWSGSDWLSVMSPDGCWRWDGRVWVALAGPGATRPKPARGRARARILQALLGAWITAVVLELFVVEIWFTLTVTTPSGAVIPLQWGVVSTVLAGAIAVGALWWLIPVARPALRMVRDSQGLGALSAFWIGLGTLYIATDAFLAEGVRGMAINGPETRWPVLLSAAFGIAAAVAAIVLVHNLTDAVVAMDVRTGGAER